MPGSHLDILIEYITQGYADVRNPFSGRTIQVDLRPDYVHTLVLWSKNFGKFLEKDRFFRNYHLYFLFTLNDMPSLEINIPPLRERLYQAEEIARRYGGGRVGWRYDPVVFNENGPVSSIKSFAKIGEKMSSFGIKRAIFSFLDFYGKVKIRNQKLDLGMVEPGISQKTEYSSMLAEKAAELGLELEHCSESLEDQGFNSLGCINGALLSSLAGESAPLEKDKGQRKSCRCTVSRDIGSYKSMPCSHGCVYCYANPVVNENSIGSREK
jgi:hypothetical protein